MLTNLRENKNESPGIWSVHTYMRWFAGGDGWKSQNNFRCSLAIEFMLQCSIVSRLFRWINGPHCSRCSHMFLNFHFTSARISTNNFELFTLSMLVIQILCWNYEGIFVTLLSLTLYATIYVAYKEVSVFKLILRIECHHPLSPLLW